MILVYLLSLPRTEWRIRRSAAIDRRRSGYSTGATAQAMPRRYAADRLWGNVFIDNSALYISR